jgi:hypothetical protein
MSTEPEDFRDKFDDGGLASNMSLLDHFAGKAMIVLLKELFITEKQEEKELMETRIEDDYPLYSENPSEKARDLAHDAYFYAFHMIYHRGHILEEWDDYIQFRKDMERRIEESNDRTFKIHKERREKKDLELLERQKEREAQKDRMEIIKAWAIKKRAEKANKGLGN